MLVPSRHRPTNNTSGLHQNHMYDFYYFLQIFILANVRADVTVFIFHAA